MNRLFPALFALFALGAGLLLSPGQARAQFTVQAPAPSPQMPMLSSLGSSSPPVEGGGARTNVVGSAALTTLLKVEQIPKLASMVTKLRRVKERLTTLRDDMEKVRDFTERDYLEMGPRNAMATTLFGEAGWYEDLEDGLEELQGISYTLNDIRGITEDVYPGDMPYSNPVEEALTQTTRKLSTARNSIVTMRGHYEQMEEDKEVLENLALDNRDAEGRRQLMQTQTRVQLHQTKNARMLRQQIATLTNLIATSETEKTNRRLQEQATRRKEAEQIASMPWPEERALPSIED